MSRRWKEPERRFRAWAAGDEPASLPYQLGQVQFVAVDESLTVANLVGQSGIRARGGRPPVRYDAIREGLARVAQHAKATNAAVHMPRIGCGLAGGTWDEIEPIIRTELVDRSVPVVVYDLPQ